MTRRARMLLVMTAGFFALPLTVDAGAEPTVILRDIRGPLPPSGLPPFAASFAILLVTGAVIWGVRRRGRRSAPAFSAQSKPVLPRDMLVTLGEQYRQGIIPAWSLVEHLFTILRMHLAGQTGIQPSFLTAEELLHNLKGMLCPDTLSRVAILLQWCDRVRFGAFRPDAAEIDWAISETAHVIESPSEKIS